MPSAEVIKPKSATAELASLSSLDLPYQEVTGFCFLAPELLKQLQRKQPVIISAAVLWADSRDLQIEIARISINDLLVGLRQRLHKVQIPGGKRPVPIRMFVPEEKGKKTLTSLGEKLIRVSTVQNPYVLTANDLALLAEFGQEGYHLTITMHPSDEQRQFANRGFKLITGTEAREIATRNLKKLFQRVQQSVKAGSDRGYLPPSSMAASGR